MKPSFLAPDIGGIPDFLRQIPNWILWKYLFHEKRKKWIKMPVDAKAPHKHASTSDPTTWCDFPTCELAYLLGGGDGLGLVNNGEIGQVWIDFDRCRLDESWTLKPEIEDYLNKIEGYCEVSPSGNGLHLITKGDLPKAFKNDAMGVEVYAKGRYFTVTGMPYNGFHVDSLKTQDLGWFITELEAKKRAESKPSGTLSPNSKGHIAGTSMLVTQDGSKSFWDKVNDLAMQDLGSWVPNLFAGCDLRAYHDGFRVPSGELDRDNEEDISIVPEGIVDFGVADQDDARQGKRTPMDLVMEWGHKFFEDPLQVSDLKSAAFWLCEQMKVKPERLGYKSSDPPKNALKLVWADDLKPDFSRPQLVDGLLEGGCMSVIFGQPKSGKTFFTFTLAIHIALGTPFCGHYVQKGLVVYVVGEGAYSIEMRLAAWRIKNQAPSIPMAILPHALDMRSSVQDVQRLIQAIQSVEAESGEHVVMIVLDTLARMNAGGDENSPQDMTTLIKHGDVLRDATGAHVAWVHHSGKDTTKGMRGHSSLLGAVDSVVEITNVNGICIVEATAQRNIEAGDFANFKLERIQIGERQLGDSFQVVESCVLVQTEEKPIKPSKRPKEGTWKHAVLIAWEADLAEMKNEDEIVEQAIKVMQKKSDYASRGQAKEALKVLRSEGFFL